MSYIRKYIWIFLFSLLAILTALFLYIPFIGFFKIADIYFSASEIEPQKLLTHTDLINISGWVQAFIGWCTLILLGITASQIYFIRQQGKREKERSERELYRTLITPGMRAAKQLINCDAGRAELIRIRNRVDKVDRKNIVENRKILEETRNAFDKIGETREWPLLDSGVAGFDHIEMLVNEYNYLCKLIGDGILEESFATDLGINNFIDVYEKVEPVIILRSRLAPRYASHYTEYYYKKKWLIVKKNNKAD